MRTVPALLGAALAGLLAAGAAAVPPQDERSVAVIVRASQTTQAAAAVRASGGTVSRYLPLVAGVAGRVPANRIGALAAARGVRQVAPDAVLRVLTASGGAPPPVRSVYRAEVRADRLAAAGGRGQGITVALLDTGISPARDLAGRVLPVRDDLTGEVSPCENLSGEPTCADGYGHGTFQAGLIAGSGAASHGRFTGVAPAARLLSIKVAAADGSADVSNVLAGIQWAVSFKDRYRIRVLNLSLGTDATQSWRSDPLNYAVERAWAAGIVVVVAAGNRGPAPGTVSKPGDDPWVLTVGAVDDRGTPSPADDVLPDFSARGPSSAGVAKPDLVAPGAHLVSLRAVGSQIDTRFPAYVGRAYRRGSGTSMATAVVSGAVAQLLSTEPGLGPDRVKYLLTATARPVAGAPASAVGSGLLDAYAAATTGQPGTANAGLGRSSGLGSLDASRGSVRVRLGDPRRTVVSGLQTAQLLTWDPAGMLAQDWSARTFYASPAYLSPWYATGWYGERWQGHNWEGCSAGGRPAGPCWYGHNWQGSAWYGAWD